MSAFGGTNHNRERPKVAASRRLGGETHPWLLNGELRPNVGVGIFACNGCDDRLGPRSQNSAKRVSFERLAMTQEDNGTS